MYSLRKCHRLFNEFVYHLKELMRGNEGRYDLSFALNVKQIQLSIELNLN